MKLALVGQPNCGKSTVFNAVAGYKSATANFPGSTVTYTVSKVIVEGRELEVVDLPGTYSLTGHDDAEREALSFLATGEPSVLINVVDASRLGRSLELTLQLLELGLPVVVALNMMDEAQRKGIEVDAATLSRELGVPVVATVARRGLGLVELFEAALGAATARTAPRPPRYSREVERAIHEVEAVLGGLRFPSRVPPRLAAIKLLERDARLAGELAAAAPGRVAKVEAEAQRLEEQHGWTSDQVVCGERHTVAHAIEEKSARTRHAQIGWRERVDAVLMHPLFGLPVMIAIMGAFFWLVFGAGKYLEAPLLAIFDKLGAWAGAMVPPDTALGAVVQGTILGISGGLGIVLPYLVPFLIGLAALEDSGYLPRMAYLLDGVMHRLGLHGKSVVPLVLGYGCSVPAVMATRILESPRDRRVTATLAILIPCSARSTVILGLVGAQLGALAAIAVYVVNLVVTAGLAVVLERKTAAASPGLILEVPDLRAPSGKTVFARAWVAIREFLAIAWPMLIASSILLSLLQVSGFEAVINRGLSPLTVTLLGLPLAVGTTIVFGVLRKELSLMMLVQALGTTAVATVMTPAQMITFALFVVFYVPCVATLAVLWRELGWKETAWIGGMTVVLATAVAVAGRFATGAFY